MNHRQMLINQVKEEYTRLAQMPTGPGGAYYEELLGQVLKGIEQGRFDYLRTGREVVDTVGGSPRHQEIRM